MNNQKIFKLISISLPGLFYFAGHGYASNNLLYLLPTDAPCMNDITARSCISVQSLAETLQRRCEPELTIILPDTCRVK